MRITTGLNFSIVCGMLLCMCGVGFGQGRTIFAEFPLDGNMLDISGNNNNGRIINGPVYEEGVLGQALHFDGIDDIAGVSAPGVIEDSTVALSFWFNADQTATVNQYLVSRFGGGGGNGYRLWIDGTTGQIHFTILDGANQLVHQVSSSFPLTPGVWTSVSAIYNGTQLLLYVHGRLADTLPVSGLGMGTARRIYFGADRQGNYFDGLMDHIILSDGLVDAETVCGDAQKLWDGDNSLCIDETMDVTEALDLGDTAHRHFGIAVVDVNHDGWVDVYYPNGLGDPVNQYQPSGTCPLPGDITTPNDENYNTMYMNNGDGTFSGDVAAEYGLADWWNAMRHVWADYDNDGIRDLISHNFVKSPLYRGISIDPPLWEDVTTQSELEICLKRGTGVSWVDLNNDGFLDIYAVEYDAQRLAIDHVSKMYLNDGDGTFTEITDAAGINLPDNAMGIAFSDYDNDGDQDVFITNSHEAPSRLYRHDGLVDGIPVFTDAGAIAGVAIDGEAGRGFGAAWGDYNNDGLMDLLYTREADTRLFRNDGDNGSGDYTFTDVTGQNGFLANAGAYQDGNFADLNNDGWLDILLANAITNPNIGHNLVYLSKQGNGWVEIGGKLGMNNPAAEQQGVVPADMDNDGDVDIFWYSHNNGHKNYVFENKHRGNNWIQVRLTGTTSNRDAVGARIRVRAQIIPGQSIIQMREVYAGTGFFSDMPRIQTFGIGTATRIGALEITWPSGLVETHTNLGVNQRFDFVEPLAPASSRRNGGEAADGATAGLDGVPQATSLAGNYPNPFNPETTIRYTLKTNELVNVKVFDLLGQEVATLANGYQVAGAYDLKWDGTDSRGNQVASGVYIYRMRAGDFVQSKQMMLSR